jgi:hypothetical protein
MYFFPMLAVFPSIVLALGVSRILAGLAYLVVHRRRVTWSWPVVAWGLFFIVASVAQGWNFLLSWSNPDSYSIYNYLYMLASPAILFFIASLMFLSLPEAGQIDLWDHFDRVRPWVFVLAVIHALAYFLDAYLVAGRTGTTFVTQMPVSQAIMTLVIAALVGVGAFLSSKTYQKLLFPVVFVLYVILYAFFV